jgi:hypothetical protein
MRFYAPEYRRLATMIGSAAALGRLAQRNLPLQMQVGAIRRAAVPYSLRYPIAGM